METETSGSKSYNAMALATALMAGNAYVYENFFRDSGPGNPAARNRRGRTLGKRNGEPFQDSNGKWYYYDKNGCMRKHNV